MPSIRIGDCVNGLLHERDNYKALWNQSCQMVAQIVEETGTAKDGEARDLWTLRECVARLRSELDALKAALPKTKDGEVVVVGLKVWKCDAIDPEEDIAENDISVETVAGIHRDWVSMKGEWPEEHTSVDEIYRRHPITGKTPEES